MLDQEEKRAFFMKINDGKYAMIIEKWFGMALIDLYQNLMPNLYLSKHGLDAEPFYLRFISETDEFVIKSFSFLIQQTRESGIFDNWLNQVLETSNAAHKSGQRMALSLQYVSITFTMFKAIFRIFSYACLSSSLVLLIEIIAANRNKTIQRIERKYKSLISYLFNKTFD
jgi:hypothetical protein